MPTKSILFKVILISYPKSYLSQIAFLIILTCLILCLGLGLKILLRALNWSKLGKRIKLKGK